MELSFLFHKCNLIIPILYNIV